MFYIYKIINNINNKIYIGQTNNLQKRRNSHFSDSFNKKSKGYKLPIHSAIRKYGKENFSFEIIEEIDESLGRNYLNEREIFYIEKFQSTIKNNNYNITFGGKGVSMPKKTFTECCSNSILFTEEQIIDIQSMLINKYQYFEIQDKYPLLSLSFLSNINNGYNFKRDELDYPLFKGERSGIFSKDKKQDIIKELKTSKSLTEISKEYGISRSYLSQINSGKRWYDEKEGYPLFDREKIRVADNIKKHLIFSDLSLKDISIKLSVGYSTVKKINDGTNRKDFSLKYPLNKNKIENQKVL